VKPSNIMLKRAGNAKLIDIGSAIDLRTSTGRRFWSPGVTPPRRCCPAAKTRRGSDLASLGYVLIEMLAGQSPFAGLTTYNELLAAKQQLPQRLPALLPQEVGGNELLLHLCRRLIAPDPARRFASAEAADLGRRGAAAFHRQLVKGDLASEYQNDIRVCWNSSNSHTPSPLGGEGSPKQARRPHPPSRLLEIGIMTSPPFRVMSLLQRPILIVS